MVQGLGFDFRPHPGTVHHARFGKEAARNMDPEYYIGLTGGPKNPPF